MNEAPAGPLGANSREPSNVALTRQRPSDGGVNAIAALPPAQRTVIRMRDLEGYAPEEVCAALHVSEGNQRVLLHRALSRVRAALEAHLAV